MKSATLAHTCLLGVVLLTFGHAGRAQERYGSEEDLGPTDQLELPPEDPATLPYETGDPIPPGYVVEETGSTALMIAGASVFGLFYVPLVVDDPGNPYRWFPFAGPVDLFVHERRSAQSCPIEVDCQGWSGGPSVFFFLGESLGAVLFLVGMPGNPDELHRVSDVTFATVPIVSENSVGFVTVGEF